MFNNLPEMPRRNNRRLRARSGRRFVCRSWPLALALSRLALPGWLPRGPDIVELVLPLGLEWIVPRLRDILGKLDMLHLVHIALAIWKDCARFHSHGQLRPDSARHQGI